MLNIEAQLTGLTNIDIQTALALDYKGVLVEWIPFRVTAQSPIDEGVSLSEIINGMPILARTVMIDENTFISYGNDRFQNHPIIMKLTPLNLDTWYDNTTPLDIKVDIYCMRVVDTTEIAQYVISFQNYIRSIFKVVE